MNTHHQKFMQRAIELAKLGMQNNSGGPFGAVVVRNNEIISEGYNCVTSSNDPTAHAEMVAIRRACSLLNSFQLEDCILYTSCEPCPMCLGAIYWARPKAVYYGCDRKDAADISFDDQFIYREIARQPEKRQIKFARFMRPEALTAFEQWKEKPNKTPY